MIPLIILSKVLSLFQCLRSNQYGSSGLIKQVHKFKKVFDGQCAGQKTQMLRVSYENTYIIELKSHIQINKNTITIMKIHNRAAHLNKCKIKKENETL